MPTVQGSGAKDTGGDPGPESEPLLTSLRTLALDPSRSTWYPPAPSCSHGPALAELCHDLRHPVAVIDALVAAVQIECDLPPQAKARLGQIATEARRIGELCAEVIAENIGGRAPLLRLDCVAAEVVAAARARFAGITVAAAPVVAAIDDASARRIVWNLVDNAVRAAGPNGQVLVAVWSTETRVRLEVGDSGPGFGHGAKGLGGLGLSIVQTTAARFGGEVEVGESELGGALVAVLLPPPDVDLTESLRPGAGDGQEGLPRG